MRHVLLVCILCSLSACLLDTETNGDPLSGTYDLSAWREDGSPETKGWIQITMDPDSVLSGTWQLAGVDGDGRLAGRSDGDMISMDLHPGWADHNFLLHGSRVNGEMIGSWEFVGFAGPMKSGSFTATRRGTK